MILDRFICTKSKPGGAFQSIYCNIKHIGWNNLKVDLHGNLTIPTDDAWVHVVFYHKFNGITYSKFPIDIWENLCDYLAGRREKTFGMNWLLTPVLKYANFNHPCPLQGLLSIKADNISIDIFAFELSLMPSGKYRIEVSFTGGDRVPGFEYKMYGSISDHRLEMV